METLYTQQSLNTDKYHYLPEVTNCPHCKSKHFVANGKTRKGMQNYFCKECRKYFCKTTNTIFFHMKLVGIYFSYGKEMINNHSIRYLADFYHIAISTSFNMRHKHLASLNAADNSIMSGVVEVASLMHKYSEKGRKDIDLPPKSLVNRMVSSLFVLDRKSNLSATIIRQSKIDNEKEKKFLRTRLESDSFVVASKALLKSITSYYSTFRYRVINQPFNRNLPFNCLRINIMITNFLMWMKKFRGVATKYLQHYLKWYVTIHRAFQMNNPQEFISSLGSHIYGTWQVFAERKNAIRLLLY